MAMGSRLSGSITQTEMRRGLQGTVGRAILKKSWNITFIGTIVSAGPKTAGDFQELEMDRSPLQVESSGETNV